MFIFVVGWLFLTYFLYNVFGWTVFKQLGADVAVRQQMWVYHFHMLFLKLDVYFLLGFSFQFVYLVLYSSPSSTAYHILVVPPVAIIVLIIAYMAILKENKTLMITTIVGLLGCLGYMINRLVDVSLLANEDKYHSSKKGLLFF
eukprot:jgi/Hompol1/4969/HPOL_004081-RA